jgi:sigma-B regulation protein RsbU (phosphoserine phosphatase)
MPGDRLLLYTDGLMDARRADRERFSQDRVEDVIRAQAGRSAQEMIDGLLSAVQEFAGDAPQYDDITLVAVVRR